MLASSALFTENIYKRFLRKGRSERHYLWVGRFAALAIVAFSLILQMSFTDVIDAIKFVVKTIAPITAASPILTLASSHRPTGAAGIVGTDYSALTALGVVLTAAAIAGWVLSIRDRVGVAELFFPLYAGLILLWPAVWAGDRFALPLYPLVFLVSGLEHARRALGVGTRASEGAPV